MKKFSFLFLVLILSSCDPKAWQQILESGSGLLSNADISAGLKEALDKGVDKSVRTLAAQGGYLDSAYKILLPDDATKIIEKLKFIPGFENLEQEAIKKINQAAEDAASKASPIFVSAVRQMTFDDVMNILMGEKNAATQYLHSKTYAGLYNEFKPVMNTSLNKFGALDLWTKAISKYNGLPFVKRINPDLADHVTGKALVGLFDLIEKKELGIRTDLSQRTSDLLRRVFAKQD